jgi:uncharacterized protein
VKFAVEAWAAEYGSPVDAEQLELSENSVDLEVERATREWESLWPKEADVPERVLFTDGVRRIDARVWITDEDGESRPGVCASYAAGAVSCDGKARLVDFAVERGLFSAVRGAQPIRCRYGEYKVRRSDGDQPEQLWLAIQGSMGDLESTIASKIDAELMIVDGPLRTGRSPPGSVGYVKTHHVSYLPPTLNGVVNSLEPGRRTPLFLTLGRWSRFSWYLRLPGDAGHPWAGVVRCETTADREVGEVVRLADTVTATLPRFASHSHKEPRAPQNLYPIAGLERELRHRLGDAQLLYRGLKRAAAENTAS